MSHWMRPRCDHNLCGMCRTSRSVALFDHSRTNAPRATRTSSASTCPQSRSVPAVEFAITMGPSPALGGDLLRGLPRMVWHRRSDRGARKKLAAPARSSRRRAVSPWGRALYASFVEEARGIASFSFAVEDLDAAIRKLSIAGSLGRATSATGATNPGLGIDTGSSPIPRGNNLSIIKLHGH